MTNYLLLSIVGKGESEKLMKAAKAAGSTGGTILNARGTACNRVLAFLCLGDAHKEILLSLVLEEQYEAVFQAITNQNHVHGICASIPSKKTYLNRKNIHSEGDQTMNTTWELIQVVCNSGYAEDVMDVARKAGAGGGTIVDGRGTSKPDDVKFFGASLVPEKELLLILVEQEKSESVFSAITSMPGMQEPGNGIVFSLPVDRFVPLGKKA